MTWALTISRRAVPQRLGRSARALRRHVSRVGRVPAFEREGRRLLRAGSPPQPTARHRGRVWCAVDAHKFLLHILHHSSRTPCPRTYPARSSFPLRTLWPRLVAMIAPAPSSAAAAALALAPSPLPPLPPPPPSPSPPLSRPASRRRRRRRLHRRLRRRLHRRRSLS